MYEKVTKRSVERNAASEVHIEIQLQNETAAVRVYKTMEDSEDLLVKEIASMHIPYALGRYLEEITELFLENT